MRFLKLDSDKVKKKSKQKRRKTALNNKKHRDNKIRKAKEIIAKNKEKPKQEAAKNVEEMQLSLHMRIFRIVKRVFLSILIAVLAFALISFVVVRVNGGTPEIFGYSVQRVVSGSMKPTLQVGDIILSKSVSAPDELDIDDIVTFQGGSEFEYNKVTHRVVVPPMVNVDGEYTLTTKGDANEKADGEILFSTVLSKFITKIDFLNRFYEFFMSPWGLLIFIALLLVIFFDELLTVVRVITGNYEEDEDDEDENVGEIMERLRREEIEARVALELKKIKKQKNPKKYDNTSRKKLKNRKKQKKR